MLYVLESRPTGVILHAINVNNITTDRRHVQLHHAGLVERPHARRPRPIGTAVSEQLFQITFTGVTTTSRRRTWTTTTTRSSSAIRRTHPARHQHRHCRARRRMRRISPVTCGAAQLQSPVFVERSGDRLQRDGSSIVSIRPAPRRTPASRRPQGGAGTSVGIAGGTLRADRRRHQQSDHRRAPTTRQGFRVARNRYVRSDVHRGRGTDLDPLLGPATTLAPVDRIVRRPVLVDEQRQFLCGRGQLGQQQHVPGALRVQRRTFGAGIGLRLSCTAAARARSSRRARSPSS